MNAARFMCSRGVGRVIGWAVSSMYRIGVDVGGASIGDATIGERSV